MNIIAQTREGKPVHLDDLRPEAQSAPYEPVPGFYQGGMGNWIEDIQLLTHLTLELKSRVKGRRPVVVEIGTAEGRTALTMNNQGVDVHCIDIWNKSMTCSCT